MEDILCLRLGVTNCYLLKGEKGWVLVDAGNLRKETLFKVLLNKKAVNAQDIKLIIITHAHYDHVGSLAGIKDICGCPVLAHQLEAEIMAAGEVTIPPGTSVWGKMVSSLASRSPRIMAYKPVECEIEVAAEYDLNDFGIKGRILSTPGHTAGSISLLLDNGNAFVGDLAMNWTGFNVFPAFAEMPEEIYVSWNNILKQGAKNIFPAHGRPFAINRIENILNKRKQFAYRMA